MSINRADPGRLLIFALSLVLTFAVAMGAGYALRGDERAVLRIPNGEQQETSVKGVVQSVTADSITVSTEGGPVTLKLGPSTPREGVKRTSLASIRPGDWVNAGGVHHNQTVYALTVLVVIPAANLEPSR